MRRARRGRRWPPSRRQSGRLFCAFLLLAALKLLHGHILHLAHDLRNQQCATRLLLLQQIPRSRNGTVAELNLLQRIQDRAVRGSGVRRSEARTRANTVGRAGEKNQPRTVGFMNSGGGWLTAELGPRSAISDRCKPVRIPANLWVGNIPEFPEACG